MKTKPIIIFCVVFFVSLIVLFSFGKTQKKETQGHVRTMHPVEHVETLGGFYNVYAQPFGEEFIEMAKRRERYSKAKQQLYKDKQIDVSSTNFMKVLIGQTYYMIDVKKDGDVYIASMYPVGVLETANVNSGTATILE